MTGERPNVAPTDNTYADDCPAISEFLIPAIRRWRPAP
jgi:hypothetical protein